MKVKLKVAAGTVTYGDRSGFLYKNVDRLLAEGFDYIYVLFNIDKKISLGISSAPRLAKCSLYT